LVLPGCFLKIKGGLGALAHPSHVKGLLYVECGPLFAPLFFFYLLLCPYTAVPFFPCSSFKVVSPFPQHELKGDFVFAVKFWTYRHCLFFFSFHSHTIPTLLVVGSHFGLLSGFEFSFPSVRSILFCSSLCPPDSTRPLPPETFYHSFFPAFDLFPPCPRGFFCIVVCPEFSLVFHPIFQVFCLLFVSIDC